MKRNRMVMVSTFLMLYSSTSYFCTNIISESINTLIYFFAVLLVLLNRKTNRHNINSIFIVALLSLLGLFSSVLANDDLKHTIYPIIIHIIAYVYIVYVEFEEFKKAFIDIMSFVAAFSVITYVLYMVFPGIFAIFPRLTNTSGHTVYNLFFAVISPGSLVRAQGFFWEPGAFQTFINIALSLWAFSKNNKRWQPVALFFALVLSFSTTGYIVGILNLALFSLRNYKGEIKRFAKLLLCLIAICIALYLLYPFIPRTFYGTTFGFEKISRFLNGPSAQTIDSSSVRFDSIYYPFKLFIANPIFGVGYNGLQGLSSIMGHSMVTCTPINYFAIYGTLYGLIVMTCIYKYARTVTRYKLTATMLFAIFIISTISEQYVNYMIMDIFIMYGAAHLMVIKVKSPNIQRIQADSCETIRN